MPTPLFPEVVFLSHASAASGPVDRWAVGTVVARNYVAYARVLEDSIRASDPGVHVVTLIVDGTPADRAGSGLGAVALPEDLGLPAEELEPMLLMYDVMELSTALKPALLRALMGRGYTAVAYFDPDIWVRASIAEVFEAATEHGIALTPHTLRPVPRDGLEIAERTIMHAGIFNLGFIAVGDGGRELLDWWHERLRTDAVVDFGAALFTDQRWIDWVPALWTPHVLRDPGYNVAYWNIHERPIERAADGTELAAGSLLRFVHFSGFDASRPWALSRFTQDRPRTLLADEPVLADLALQYSEALAAAGHAERRRTPYGLDTLPGGLRLSPEMRRVYRDALIGALPVPVPPLTGWSRPKALADWLVEPVQATAWVAFAPIELALWRSRPDLRATFPDLFGSDARALRTWLDTDRTAALYRTDHGLPAPAELRAARAPSWSVVAGTGRSGEIADLVRRIHGAAVAAGLDAELVERVPGPARTATGEIPAELWRRTGGDDRASSARPRDVVVGVDAEVLDGGALAGLLEDAAGVRIALWLTGNVVEISHHGGLLAAFDAVWTVSPAVTAAVRAVTDIPVIEFAIPPATVRTTGDPEGRPRFLVDVDPSSERSLEAAAAAIDAYRAAFDPEGPGLHVRPRYGPLSPLVVERLRYLSHGRPDVTLGEVDVGVSADVLFSLDPRPIVGLDRVDATAAGMSVVTAGPGGTVDGTEPQGNEETLVGRVRSAGRSTGPHGDAPVGADVATLFAAATRRYGRAELPRRESPRSRAERAEAELTALRATRLFRWTRKARAIVTRLPRRGRS